jgi:hypothetical protein
MLFGQDFTRAGYGISAFFQACDFKMAFSAAAAGAAANDYLVPFYVPGLRSYEERSEASISSGMPLSETTTLRGTNMLSCLVQEGEDFVSLGETSRV